MITKKEVLGQYFTKPEIVKKLLGVLSSFCQLPISTKILEPSSGTGNFVAVLRYEGYKNIEECEIDPGLTDTPQDFFELPTSKKFDLIIGNPPFSKYNLKDSYYQVQKYSKSSVYPSDYLDSEVLKKQREKIENVFILKSIKHLKGSNSIIAFILPISFFIKGKNRTLKNFLTSKFSSFIVYQNDQTWFDRNIPCCFLILSNLKEYQNKIVTIFDNGERNEKVFSLGHIHEELIPQVIFNKHSKISNGYGIPLSEYLDDKVIRVNKSFRDNTVSAKNIIMRTRIPSNSTIEKYKIAVVRVGNSSVGRSGFINPEKDVLNDMFYVFDFKPAYKADKSLKEKICSQINNNIDYFRNITIRVGSKSIKKNDVLDFKVTV